MAPARRLFARRLYEINMAMHHSVPPGLPGNQMKKHSEPKTRKHRVLNATKAGKPPGSIIHLGEVKVAKPSITLFDYSSEGLMEARFGSVEESREYRKKNELLWLNVHGLHEPSVMEEIGTRFGLHPLVLEDIANTQQRPKFDDFKAYVFVVLRVFHYDASRRDAISDQISIIASPDYLISFQERPTGLFNPVRERLRQNVGNIRSQGIGALLHALLDAVVDQYFVVVEAVSNDVETLEDTILAGKGLQPIEEINHFKRETLEIRRAIWPLREVLGGLQRQSAPLVSGETQMYFRDVYDHTVHVLEQLDGLRDLVAGLMDLHLSSVSNRLNAEVRVLTIITTLFAPATLLTGFFGMNFQTMPWLERPNGWLLVAIAIVLAGAALMGALYWQRWWVRMKG